MATYTTPETVPEHQIFVKPAGALCNLNCSYCYYLPKSSLYAGERAHRMPEELLESYIIQQIEAAPDSVVNFFWHGGEPTLSGLDYFRRIVELEHRHKRPGMTITNGIQTNGILIDEQWCRFFATEGFLVGISIDGPPCPARRLPSNTGRENNAPASDTGIPPPGPPWCPRGYPVCRTRPERSGTGHCLPLLQGDQSAVHQFHSPGRTGCRIGKRRQLSHRNGRCFRFVSVHYLRRMGPAGYWPDRHSDF